MDGRIDRSIGSDADQNTKFGTETEREGGSEGGGTEENVLKNRNARPPRHFTSFYVTFGSHRESQEGAVGKLRPERRKFALFMTSNRPRAACYHTTQVEKHHGNVIMITDRKPKLLTRPTQFLN